MRRIHRLPLPAALRADLKQRQTQTNTRLKLTPAKPEAVWNSARQTKPLKAVLAVLKQMAGLRERCYYCVDSHGTDIEHFWPKRYPRQLFRWANLLLCCTECGRFKGEQFPLSNRRPLLVNPTAENPWQFMDFDPITGNITARFDTASNDWSPKGTQTVKTLHLDEREALATGYLKTWRRLQALFESALSAGPLNAQAFCDELSGADDHGLAGWCIVGNGRLIDPMQQFQLRHPVAWAACVKKFG